MKIIIPVKSQSERIINKNFRPFYKNMSLTDILVEKLLKIVNSRDIYISCDDTSIMEMCKSYEINFVKRDKVLIHNETPMSKVITEVVDSIPGDDDIMWCLVTDPLFNSYRACIEKWRSLDKKKYDSLCVVYNLTEYILDSDFKPINFGLGENHVPTQNLKKMYLLNNTLFIIQRESLFKNQYYIGEKPYWFIPDNFSIDIDTEQDFKAAQILYEDFEEWIE
jgi:CMP-N-acetylneuraminic acid synthetase